MELVNLVQSPSALHPQPPALQEMSGFEASLCVTFTEGQNKQMRIRPRAKFDLLQAVAGCMYRKPHPEVISVFAGEIAYSCAWFPDPRK